MKLSRPAVPKRLKMPLLRFGFGICCLNMTAWTLAELPPEQPQSSDSAHAKPISLEQMLLNLSYAKLCNPDSEMFCQPHTVFIKGDYAVVLASVQPTAGLFQVFHQKSQAQPQTDQHWELIGTYQLSFYEETLLEAKLPKAPEAYFMQAIAAFLKSP